MRCDATWNLVIFYAFLLHSDDRLSSIIKRHASVITVIASGIKGRRFRSRSSYARHACMLERYLARAFQDPESATLAFPAPRCTSAIYL